MVEVVTDTRLWLTRPLTGYLAPGRLRGADDCGTAGRRVLEGSRGPENADAGWNIHLWLFVAVIVTSECVDTCHLDYIKDVHFDTNHFSHVIWTNPVDLQPKLQARIETTLGRGSNATFQL